MDVFKVRRENLRQLIKTWSGPANLAAKLGYSNASFIVQMAGPHPVREVSEKTARAIESKLALPLGWFDQPQVLKPVNETKVAQVVRAVGAVLGDHKLTLPPEKFAEVVALVYEHAALTGELSEEYIQKIVTLTR